MHVEMETSPAEVWRMAEAYLRKIGTGEKDPEEPLVGICANLDRHLPHSFCGYAMCEAIFERLGLDRSDPLHAQGFSYTNDDLWEDEAGVARRGLCMKMADWIKENKL